jgi:hypothetical protein
MGSGRFDDSSYRSFAKSSTTRADGSAKSVRETFVHNKLAQSLDPKGALMRESRDSETSPKSRAIIIGLDVTGSMGRIAHSMVETQLGDLMGSIFETSPVKDPHIMIMGIGDIACDRAPFQVSQFEADIRIAKQLSEVFMEGGGGGNNTESYDLPWYFAANHTSLDCFEKRGEKGYLFTIGDEMPPHGVTSVQLKDLLGVEEASSHTAKEMYDAARKTYDVFHIIVEEGSYVERHGPAVLKAWDKLIGRYAIPLSNFKRLSEVITAVIRVNEGEDADDVIACYPDCTKVIQHALRVDTAVAAD